MAGWLIAEQQLGALGERPGDCHTLLLAAGELRGKRFRLPRKTDQGQIVIRALRDAAAIALGGSIVGCAAARMAKAMFSRASRLASRFAPWNT